MEPSRNDFVGKTHRYETIGIDPLIGKNLWDNVAVSSPCIGKYKLTCLQNNQSSSRLRALSPPLSNPSGSCWSILLGDCLVCNLFSLCSCVGCVGLLLLGLRYNSPCGCVVQLFVDCVTLFFLGCVVQLFRGLCYLSLRGCVTLPFVAVLYCYFVDPVEGCSILLVRKGFHHPRSSLLTTRIFAGKQFQFAVCILF